MFNLNNWLDKYVEAVDAAFGARLVFIGLQGSYARGEAHAGSDIDVVVILDEATFADLEAYRTALAGLPERGKVCGFIGGADELQAWERAELFQFYHDTVSVYGSLNFLAPLINENSIRRAVLTSACGIYHACAHNFVHEQSLEVLQALYKTAVFALQAKYYLATGRYVKRRADLLPLLEGLDKNVLAAAMAGCNKSTLEELTAPLWEWSASVIKEFGGGENAKAED